MHEVGGLGCLYVEIVILLQKEGGGQSLYFICCFEYLLK